MEISQPLKQVLKHAPMTMACCLLSILLLLQGSVYFRENLARIDLVRPMLFPICHWLGCKVPPKRDLSKLAISNRQLITHPQIAESLRLKATLSNAANFDQPYPTLYLEFTDHNGKVVASRQLKTRDYLIDHQDNKLMLANSDVQIILDLVKPSARADGFALYLKDGEEL